MKRVWPILVLLASVGCSKATDTASSATATVPANGFVEARLRTSEGALPDLLALHAKKAKELGLAPYAELGATWCKPCRELEASMSDARMKDAFKGTYIVHLDIDEWGGSLGKSGLGSSAVPVVFALDPQTGKGTSRTIDGSAWDANIPANMAPKLGAFFQGK
jgi:hypothetical protein